MTITGLGTRDGGAIPLKGVEVEGEVLGAHARVRVRQRYRNDAARAVEAVYTFPLPADATLTGFSMECEGRRFEGVVKEREAAFRAYDDAVVAGHGAALLEQERANVFTASVGNLLPGEETLVEVEYVQRLGADEGSLRWAIPTLVAPRYIPGAPAGDRTAHGERGPTDRVPDADRVTPPRVAEVPYGLRVDVAFDLGREVRVESPSHAIATERDGRVVRVRFHREEVALDRDVVLVARGVEQGVGQTTSVVAHREPGKDGYLALAVVPDLWSLGAETARGQRVVFVIDVSGSMEGDSIREARAALKLCLRHLRAGDRFNVVAFSTTYASFEREAVPFTQQSLDRADRWVDALAADGGTEMLEPLTHAVAMAEGGVVMLLTDGEVGNEDEILRAVLKRRGDARTRVCSFGIGTNVSDALLRDLARETGGAVEFIHPGERIDEKVVAQFSRAVAPRVTDVAVRFVGVDAGEAAPARAPDLVDGDTWSVFARYARGGSGHAELEGRYEGKPFSLKLPLDLPEEASRPVVARLWAAERVRDFEDARVEGRRAEAMKQRIVALAVEHGIASRYTSFVVVEHRTGERRTSGMPDTAVVPVGLPAGWAMFDEERAKADRAGAGGGVAKRKRGAPAKAALRAAPRGVVSAPAPAMPAAPMPAPRAAPGYASIPTGGASRGPSRDEAPAPPKASAPADAFMDHLSLADDVPAAPREEALDMDFEAGFAEAAPAPEPVEAKLKEEGAATRAGGDFAATAFSRQLASGLWDDAAIGPDTELRRLTATWIVLRFLLRDGVDTAHPLHGAPLRKALEAVAALAPSLAAQNSALAERALGAAWLLATGARTRRAVESAIAAAGLSALSEKLGNPAALREWLLA